VEAPRHALGFLDERVAFASGLVATVDKRNADAPDRGLAPRPQPQGCDHMTGRMLLVETALIKFDENGSEVPFYLNGDMSASASPTQGLSEDAERWTTRMGRRKDSSDRVRGAPHAAEIVGGARFCARHASCGGAQPLPTGHAPACSTYSPPTETNSSDRRPLLPRKCGRQSHYGQRSASRAFGHSSEPVQSSWRIRVAA